MLSKEDVPEFQRPLWYEAFQMEHHTRYKKLQCMLKIRTFFFAVQLLDMPSQRLEKDGLQIGNSRTNSSTPCVAH